MAYIERQGRGEKEYFYVTKNFRLAANKWKKIRRYCGSEKPGLEEFRRILDEMDSEARKNEWLKSKPPYKYLSRGLAETLEDMKQNFNRWSGRLDEITRKKFEDDFLVRFTYNSNAIEGNRLSLRDTSMILKEDRIPSGASTKDFNEAINGRDCLEYIKAYKGNLGKKIILNVHRELVKNTGCRKAGEYRDSLVRISGSEWIPPAPENVEREMAKLLGWWRNNEKNLHPIESAGIIHNMLARIHPFTDGNGRTGRVIMNWILARRKYPMIHISKREKVEYYKAIDEGDGGDDGKFVGYLAETMIKQHTFKSKKR
ncbi:MAG: Fic family protein [Candidatus Altiarchaeota archaeon]|nr:Fic family protein [Candidatus Altiarchaeota archaeon]